MKNVTTISLPDQRFGKLVNNLILAFLTGVLLLFCSIKTNAQVYSTYPDDIYYPDGGTTTSPEQSYPDYDDYSADGYGTYPDYDDNSDQGYSDYSAGADVDVDVDVVVPDWAPYYTNVHQVRYYFLPDIDMYYDVFARQFIYWNGFEWIYVYDYPAMYSSYDLYSSYVIFLDFNVYRPWRYNTRYITLYPKHYYTTHYVYYRDNAHQECLRGYSEHDKQPIYINKTVINNHNTTINNHNTTTYVNKPNKNTTANTNTVHKANSYQQQNQQVKKQQNTSAHAGTQYTPKYNGGNQQQVKKQQSTSSAHAGTQYTQKYNTGNGQVKKQPSQGTYSPKSNKTMQGQGQVKRQPVQKSQPAVHYQQNKTMQQKQAVKKQQSQNVNRNAPTVKKQSPSYQQKEVHKKKN